MFEHAYDFDPSYGYTLETLRAIAPPSEPDDLEPFWRETHERTLAVPTRIDVSDLVSPRKGFRLRLVRFDGLGGVRLGAWLVTPADDAIGRFVVVGHGYYNRPVEDISHHPRSACLYFGCRGLGVSRFEGISDQTAFHVLHGIEDKQTYVHRGCVADTWSGASVMLELFPEAAGRLEYSGGSFGGGIGAMALAWDDRFAFAKLGVPSFGHHPIRLRCRCVGAGEAVRRAVERRPEIYDRTLRYFDAAATASRIATPSHFVCATFDPSVPPPGQFAVFNAAGCDKSLTTIRAGHFSWAGTVEDDAAADSAAAAARNKAIPPSV